VRPVSILSGHWPLDRPHNVIHGRSLFVCPPPIRSVRHSRPRMRGERRSIDPFSRDAT
jgi:hypothetical protein